MSTLFTRRSLLTGVGASAAGLLCGCDRLAGHPSVREALFSAENFHRWAQRTLSHRDTLAREFRPDQISPVFRANGNVMPDSADYQRHAARGFKEEEFGKRALGARQHRGGGGQ